MDLGGAQRFRAEYKISSASQGGSGGYINPVARGVPNAS